jgi:hypothetical protein
MVIEGNYMIKKELLKKTFIRDSFIISSIIFLLSSIIFHQLILPGYLCRYFYKVGDMDFTFWKTTKGCYIMPYKYLGRTIPKNNYMIASNVGGVIIYIGENSTLYIFPSFTYKLGAGSIEVNLTSYKYEYFPYINEIENKYASNDKMKYYKNMGYPFIDIYFGEMSATIGNTSTEVSTN